MKKTIITMLAAATLVTACQTRTEMDTTEGQASVSGGTIYEGAGAGASIQSSQTADTTTYRYSTDAAGPQIGTKLSDLPAAVQNTIRQQAPNAQIADIDKEERTGQVIYEVSFKDERLNPKIHVAHDGRLVSEEEAALFHSEAAGAPRQDQIEAKPEVRGGAEALQKDAPAVDAETDLQTQSDVSTEAAGTELRADANISRDQADAEIKTEADIASEAAGAETRSTTAQPVQIRFNALPQPVQNAIRTRGGEAQVSEINRKTIYEVKFSDSDQKFMLREDGPVIEEKQ